MVEVKRKLGLFLWLSLAALSMLRGQSFEKWEQYHADTAFVAGSVRQTVDDKFLTPYYSSIENTYRVKNTITLNVEENESVVFPDSFTCTVALCIRWRDEGNIFHTDFKTLYVNYNKANLNHDTLISVYQFSGGHIVADSIISISTTGFSGAIPDIFSIHNIMEIERNFAFSCDYHVFDVDTAYINEEDELSISWAANSDTLPMEDEFDFEWTFYDDSSELIRNYVAGTTHPYKDESFLRNASRLVSKERACQIPLLYENGYVLFRIRPVKILPTGQRVAGAWTSTVEPGNSSYIFHVKSHEDSINWQSSTTFAEEGKRKSVISYFDGSSKNRQTVTKITSDSTAVVAETLYDFDGRPVVATLPSPAFDKAIKHFDLYNKNLIGQAYTWQNLYSNGGCTPVPEMMDTSSGSSKYYSPANPKKALLFHQFVPDAQGYPFSQTMYTNDLTNRVKISAGPGGEHHLRDSAARVTQYFYSGAEKSELTRLFGPEVGDHTHYFKNEVIDPNGQVAVTYTDMHGRTIATALAGDTINSRQHRISDYREAVLLRDTIMTAGSQTIQDLSIKGFKTFTVTTAALYKFNYQLLPDSLLLRTCDSSDFCFDCIYDLTIKVTDDCFNKKLPGDSAFVHVLHNYSPAVDLSYYFDTVCGNSPAPIVDSFDLFLGVGTYTVSKDLSIKPEAIDYYYDFYFRNDTCIKTFDDFYADALSAIDFSGCDVTCETCLHQLGDSATFVDSFLVKILRYNPATVLSESDTNNAIIAYEELKHTCDLMCDSFSVCDFKLQLLLLDVSPTGGQYASFDLDSLTGNYSISDSTSIFSGASSVSIFPGPGPLYNNPDLIYRDELGRPDSVYVYDSIEQEVVKKSPNNLTIKEFIRFWKPSWAKELVRFHPEYCNYLFCMDISGGHDYDQAMLSIDNYDSAVVRGFLNPLNHTFAECGFGANATNVDPFFLTEYGQRFRTAMHKQMNTYAAYDTSLSGGGLGHVNLSIWDVAALSINCTTNSGTCFDCKKQYYWNAFRNMYMGIKKSFVDSAMFQHFKDSCGNGNYLDFNSGGLTGKTKRFEILKESFPISITNMDVAQTQQLVQDSINSNSTPFKCEDYAPYWWGQLSNCGFSSADSAAIVSELVAVCKLGKDANHPYGASSTPNPGIRTDGLNYSFETVLQWAYSRFSDSSNLGSANCSHYLINNPQPYETQTYYVQTVSINRPDSCVCHNIQTYYKQYAINADSGETFSHYLYMNHEVVIAENDIQMLMSTCDSSTCDILKHPVSIPYQFGCDRICVNCYQIITTYEKFLDKFPNVQTSPNYNTLMQSYMNSTLHMNLTSLEYMQFMYDSCGYNYFPTDNLANCEAPTANNDYVSLHALCSQDILVLENDISSGGAIIRLLNPGNAFVSVVAGKLIYRSGTANLYDTITYAICNSCGLCDTARVFVYVDSASCNNPPVAVDDYFSICDSSVAVTGFTGNDLNPDGDGLYISSLFAAHGLVTAAHTNLNVTITSHGVGNDTILYVVCDSIWNSCDTGAAFITIQPCSDTTQPIQFLRRPPVPTTLKNIKMAGFKFLSEIPDTPKYPLPHYKFLGLDKPSVPVLNSIRPAVSPKNRILDRLQFNGLKFVSANQQLFDKRQHKKSLSSKLFEVMFHKETGYTKKIATALANTEEIKSVTVEKFILQEFSRFRNPQSLIMAKQDFLYAAKLLNYTYENIAYNTLKSFNAGYVIPEAVRDTSNYGALNFSNRNVRLNKFTITSSPANHRFKDELLFRDSTHGGEGFIGTPNLNDKFYEPLTNRRYHDSTYSHLLSPPPHIPTWCDSVRETFTAWQASYPFTGNTVNFVTYFNSNLGRSNNLIYWLNQVDSCFSTCPKVVNCVLVDTLMNHFYEQNPALHDTCPSFVWVNYLNDNQADIYYHSEAEWKALLNCCNIDYPVEQILPGYCDSVKFVVDNFKDRNPDFPLAGILEVLDPLFYSYYHGPGGPTLEFALGVLDSCGYGCGEFLPCQKLDSVLSDFQTAYPQYTDSCPPALITLYLNVHVVGTANEAIDYDSYKILYNCCNSNFPAADSVTNHCDSLAMANVYFEFVNHQVQFYGGFPCAPEWLMGLVLAEDYPGLHVTRAEVCDSSINCGFTCTEACVLNTHCDSLLSAYNIFNVLFEGNPRSKLGHIKLTEITNFVLGNIYSNYSEVFYELAFCDSGTFCSDVSSYALSADSFLQLYDTCVPVMIVETILNLKADTRLNYGQWCNLYAHCGLTCPDTCGGRPQTYCDSIEQLYGFYQHYLQLAGPGADTAQIAATLFKEFMGYSAGDVPLGNIYAGCNPCIAISDLNDKLQPLFELYDTCMPAWALLVLYNGNLPRSGPYPVTYTLDSICSILQACDLPCPDTCAGVPPTHCDSILQVYDLYRRIMDLYGDEVAADSLVFLRYLQRTLLKDTINYTRFMDMVYECRCPLPPIFAMAADTLLSLYGECVPWWFMNALYNVNLGTNYTYPQICAINAQCGYPCRDTCAPAATLCDTIAEVIKVVEILALVEAKPDDVVAGLYPVLLDTIYTYEQILQMHDSCVCMHISAVYDSLQQVFAIYDGCVPAQVVLAAYNQLLPETGGPYSLDSICHMLQSCSKACPDTCSGHPDDYCDSLAGFKVFYRRFLATLGAGADTAALAASLYQHYMGYSLAGRNLDSLFMVCDTMGRDCDGILTITSEFFSSFGDCVPAWVVPLIADDGATYTDVCNVLSACYLPCPDTCIGPFSSCDTILQIYTAYRQFTDFFLADLGIDSFGVLTHLQLAVLGDSISYGQFMKMVDSCRCPVPYDFVDDATQLLDYYGECAPKWFIELLYFANLDTFLSYTQICDVNAQCGYSCFDTCLPAANRCDTLAEIVRAVEVLTLVEANPDDVVAFLYPELLDTIYTYAQVVAMHNQCLGLDSGCHKIDTIQHHIALYLQTHHGVLYQPQPAFLSGLYNYLNNVFHTHARYVNWCDTLAACGDTCPLVKPSPYLCNRPLMPPVSGIEEDTCYEVMKEYAYLNAAGAYSFYLDKLHKDFVNRYVEKCLGPYERFDYIHPNSEYHFTLYYYDQAGNLVKTIPPNGFDYTWQAHHTFPTVYRYNTLNQPIQERSPDAGDTYHWYDRISKPVLSQNARQAQVEQCSYTLYDALQRIVEVGRFNNAPYMAAFYNVWDGYVLTGQDSLYHFLLDSINNPPYEITRTYYDEDKLGMGTHFGTPGQQNLRNRVASATYEDVDDFDSTTYQAASHYSYDVHGNVKTLLQENTRLQPIGQSFKRLDYQYDLVSGKVNTVLYQRGQPDQFIHKYEYDADNRITNVLTSRDSTVFTKDAFYQYYLHGPLARTILGEHRVQGIDYAYTIQGWLKMINSNRLQPNRDMGKDIIYTATDAYAFSLGYYSGDYQPVNTALTTSNTPEYIYPGLTQTDLFNGNIAHSTLALRNMQWMSKVYSYDQLNRLIDAKAYTVFRLNISPWTFTNDYYEQLSYDPNGNIITNKRNGYGATTAMDEMEYRYIPNTNKLDHVRDAVSNANYAVDIDDQDTTNYRYDAIGNLVRDSAEGLDTILWNLYGKIQQINKHNGDTLRFAYDATGNRIMKEFYKDSTGLRTFTYYVRDATGNIMATYNADKPNDTTLTYKLDELVMYGSSRLGTISPGLQLYPDSIPHSDTDITYFATNFKQYELTNHLGNVLSTISDRRIPQYPSGTFNHYEPEIVTAQDYYAFGMIMPGREFSIGGYRFGFNGKENDNEVKGVVGSQQDYGFRIYDSRLGRFLSVDPLAKSYPWYTPYQFSGNSPILNVDIDGLEPGPTQPNTSANSSECPSPVGGNNPSGQVMGLSPSAETLEKFNEAKESFSSVFNGAAKLSEQVIGIGGAATVGPIHLKGEGAIAEVEGKLDKTGVEVSAKGFSASGEASFGAKQKNSSEFKSSDENQGPTAKFSGQIAEGKLKVTQSIDIEGEVTGPSTEGKATAGNLSLSLDKDLSIGIGVKISKIKVEVNINLGAALKGVGQTLNAGISYLADLYKNGFKF